MKLPPFAFLASVTLFPTLLMAQEAARSREEPLPAGQTPSERISQEESPRGGHPVDGSPWRAEEHAFGELFGLRKTLIDHGIDLFGGVTVEAWGNPSGGLRPGATGNVLLNFGTEIHLEPLLGWPGATLHHSWFAPLGDDLSAQNVGNVFTISNATAYNSLYLYELWFQQEIGPVSLRLGQLAADAEFAQSEHGALFLNSAFGWPPFLSGNLPNGGPSFPKGTPGARIAFAPVPGITLQSAVYQGDPYDNAANRFGTRWHLGGDVGWTWMHEAQFRWSKASLPGRLKLGGWHHTGLLPDAETAHPKTDSGNHGIYAVLDQMLWRQDKERGLGGFVRVGWSRGDRNLFPFYADAGLTWKGVLPRRKDDTLGLAFACGAFSSGARETLEAEGRTPARTEMALELTYQCQVTPWMTLQPDVQWIIHPGGTRDTPNALVLGIRTAVIF